MAGKDQGREEKDHGREGKDHGRVASRRGKIMAGKALGKEGAGWEKL